MNWHELETTIQIVDFFFFKHPWIFIIIIIIIFQNFVKNCEKKKSKKTSFQSKNFMFFHCCEKKVQNEKINH
jgi:hypothetical protein